MNFDRLSSICQLQEDILMRACQMVKMGGIIIYSTCSLSTKQNELVVKSTIEKINKNKNLNYQIQLKPLFSNLPKESLLSSFGFKDSSLLHTKRIHPGPNSASAMYIARLQKLKKLDSK